MASHSAGTGDELPESDQEAIRNALPEGAEHLGPALAIHQFPSDRLVTLFAVGIANLIVGGLLLAATITITNRGGPGTVYPMVIGGIISLLMLSFGGFFFWRAFFGIVRPKFTVLHYLIVCRGGIVRINWGNAAIFTWSDLRIKKLRAAPFANRYELSGHDGAPVKIACTSFTRGPMIDIQERQVTLLRGQMRKAIESGEVVKFGSLGVTQDGFRIKKRTVKWDEIRELVLGADPQHNKYTLHFSAISRHDKTELFALNASDKMVNLWLFIELLAKVRPELVKNAADLKQWFA